MNNSRLCTFSLCALIVSLVCHHAAAQTAPTTQTDRETPNAASAATVAQTQTPGTPARVDPTFIIGDDDLLAISVWKEPDLTKQIPVRSDGRISLPLIGEVQAAGKTPAQLEKDITASLRSYITDPQVSVIVQEIRSLKFNVLGQVNKPGAYSLNTGMTIVDAVAAAGGFRDFAKKKGIYVLRTSPTGEESKLSFNYQDFIKGKNPQQNAVLKPHDTVVVP